MVDSGGFYHADCRRGRPVFFFLLLLLLFFFPKLICLLVAVFFGALGGGFLILGSRYIVFFGERQSCFPGKTGALNRNQLDATCGLKAKELTAHGWFPWCPSAFPDVFTSTKLS